MELKYRFIIKVLAGALAGIMISMVLFLFDTTIDPGSGHLAWFIQFVGSGLNGAICMGSSIFYEIDSWGLRKATVLHYLLCLGSFSITSAVLKWFPTDILLIVFLVFTVVYILIWLTEYLLWKREIRQINDDLKNIRQKEEKGIRS